MSLVLVADDDIHQLDIRKALLEAGGHRVIVALSVRDVYRCLESIQPDVLMMDLKFPNSEGVPDAEEGLTLIRAVRESKPNLPVIVLSGWPEELEGRPEENLVARIVPKPCRISVLLDAIREVLPVLFWLVVVAAGARAQSFHFSLPR